MAVCFGRAAVDFCRPWTTIHGVAKTLLYSPQSEPAAVRQALQVSTIVRAGSLAQLTRTLVSDPEVRCLVFVTEVPELALGPFLGSLSRSFSVLPVCVCSATPLPELPERYLRLDLRASEAELTESLRRFLAGCGRSERRALPRFDWPLRASLALAESTEGTYNLRALSASGAFLECPGTCPDAGSAGHLQVLFQNFSLVTDCEVLDRRQASSNLPYGFGVRFVGLSEEAQEKLDRIVRDSLVQSLLEPEAPPEVPSLGDDELLPGGFELL